MIDRKKARELRNDGLTCREIAEMLNTTEFQVHVAVGDIGGTQLYKEFTRERCIYSGIRRWLNVHKVSLRLLCEYIDPVVTGATINRVRDMLRGTRELRKSDIDRLLDLTGLTYAEAFKVD